MAQDKKEQKKLLVEIMEADDKDGLYAQQTAVEWLRNKLFDEWGIGISDNVIEQAKVMEKGQIINAYEKGAEESWDAEQYYNETYGK
jgi:hypothetical protein